MSLAGWGNQCCKYPFHFTAHNAILCTWYMAYVMNYSCFKSAEWPARCPWRYLITKREREGRGVFIKFSSHWQAACFSFILYFLRDWCEDLTVSQPQPPLADTHALPLCWLVSKVITDRLLHAFMKYSNGSMSYCALIMPHKDKGYLGDRWADSRKRPLFTEKKSTIFLSNIGGILTAREKTHLSWKCLCLLPMPHCGGILISVLKRELPGWSEEEKNRNQSK